MFRLERVSQATFSKRYYFLGSISCNSKWGKDIATSERVVSRTALGEKFKYTFEIFQVLTVFGKTDLDRNWSIPLTNWIHWYISTFFTNKCYLKIFIISWKVKNLICSDFQAKNGSVGKFLELIVVKLPSVNSLLLANHASWQKLPKTLFLHGWELHRTFSTKWLLPGESFEL